jgi:hypothetical protein
MKIGTGTPHPWVFLIAMMCNETKVEGIFLALSKGNRHSIRYIFASGLPEAAE